MKAIKTNIDFGYYHPNGVYHASCLSAMESIGDNVIGAIIVDPPYGVGYQSNNRIDKFDPIVGDSSFETLIPFIDAWLPECYRVLEDPAPFMVFTRWDVYPQWAAKISEYFEIRNVIIWDKSGGGMGDLAGNFAPSYEIMILAVKGDWKRPPGTKRIGNVWRFSAPVGVDHPTPKSIEFIRQAIQYTVFRGKIIMDTCAGSGSTLIAASQLGYPYIGFELDQAYATLAQRRLVELGGEEVSLAERVDAGLPLSFTDLR